MSTGEKQLCSPGSHEFSGAKVSEKGVIWKVEKLEYLTIHFLSCIGWKKRFLVPTSNDLIWKCADWHSNVFAQLVAKIEQICRAAVWQIYETPLIMDLVKVHQPDVDIRVRMLTKVPPDPGTPFFSNASLATLGAVMASKLSLKCERVVWFYHVCIVKLE